MIVAAIMARSCWNRILPLEIVLFSITSILVSHQSVVGWPTEAYKFREAADDTSNSINVKSESDDIRLPTSLIPDHYDLHLRPDVTGPDPSNFRLTGYVTIAFNVVDPVDRITIHAKLLDIPEDKISVTCFPSETPIPLNSTASDPEKEFFEIYLTRTMNAGDRCWIYLEFSGSIFPDLAGIYYSSYQSDDETRYLATSHLHPTEARKVFPCFDEPQLKAKFAVTLERSPSQSTLSNTVIYEQETLLDGWVADHYKDTPPMSTYLLAFIVSDFACLSTSSRGKEVQVCARPNAIDQATFALSIAGPLQEFYEDYFAIPYPLERTVHAAVPDFPAGAMENWGLIIYRETSLLYRSGSSSTASLQQVASVVAHELAHMWFGDLVTPTWWDDIWLNEGFASYMEYPSMDSIFPDWEMDSQFLSLDLHPVFQDDSLLTSHPIYQTVNNPVEINELFDSISYKKGASIIRMMQHFLGEDVFRSGLTNFLNRSAFGTAHHTDLFNALTEESFRVGQNLDVNAIMLTWILQMGYPVVNHFYDRSTGRVDLTQFHFILNEQQNSSVPESPYNYNWILPVSIETSDPELQPSYGWLNSTAGSIQVPPGERYLIGNVEERYYYRVNYDTDMWQIIINQLIDDYSVIGEINRAQIIDDLFSLGRAGVVDQLLAMNATLYLSGEVAYVPWTTAGTNMNYVDRMLMLTDDYYLVQAYMQQLSTPIYDSVGWDDNNGTDTHVQLLLRVTVLGLACHYEMTSCTSQASTLYEDWRNEFPQNPINVNLRGVVTCSGIFAGDQNDWNFAFDRYEESNVGSEKTILLQSMACSSDPAILSRYLSIAMNESGIRRQDFSTVIISVARNRYGRSLAWNTLTQNWDVIYDRFGTTSLYTLSNIVSGVTESFSTDAELAQLTSFIDDHRDQLGSSERAFSQAVENTQVNINWRQANEANIFRWLAGQTIN